MALTKESVIEALKTIIGPNGNDIVTGGEVRALSVDGKNVRLVLEIDQSLSNEYSKIREASEESVKKLGAKEVSIVLTAHASQKAPPDLKPSLGGLGDAGGGDGPPDRTDDPPLPTPRRPRPRGIVQQGV